MTENLVASKEHCVYCFGVLDALLEKNSTPNPPFPSSTECAVFITFSRSPNDSLRGCIGTFSPDSLWKQLAKYTRYAAFNDSRFRPIVKAELEDLSVGVSLLFNFQEKEKGDLESWELEKHGIILEYEGNTGTYLPEVATQTGWSKEEMVHSCLKDKVGISVNKDILKNVTMTTYETSKTKLTYKEYLKKE
eukprot:snap_masked-scaffold_17-processed-gene-3.12-mRNA-1 protein AED:0.39 eAED:0.39 QI:0/-1/0/1/-1/1/1/0/190